MGQIQRTDDVREGNRPCRLLDDHPPLQVDYNDRLYTVRTVFQAEDGTAWYGLKREETDQAVIWWGLVDRTYQKMGSFPEYLIRSRSDVQEYKPNDFVRQGL